MLDKKPFCLLFAILLCTGIASAAGLTVGPVTTPEDTQTYVSPFEVLITAPRVTIPLRENPAATSVVTGEEIHAGVPRGASIDEALKLVPGVKIDNQADGERVHMSIRGQGILTETGIRSIKILLDELPINDPSGFAPDFFDVDLNTVDRIEVLRGAAASLYGGGAAGGILNIRTMDAPKTPLFGSISTTGGSNGFWKSSGQFGGDANDVNYMVSLSRTGGEGYRVHTHFWQNSAYAKATYTPTSSFRITPIVEWNDTYHENPEGLSLAQYTLDPKLPNDDAIPFNEHMETNRVTWGVTGHAILADNQELSFNGFIKQTEYVEVNNHVYDYQKLSTPGTSVQYTFSTGSPDGSYRNQISAGTDLQWQTNDEYLTPNDHTVEDPTNVLARQQITQRGTGFFLIDRIDLNHDWSFTGSLRYDKIHNELADKMITDSTDNSGNADFSNVTGRLGFTYAPAQDISFYGSWAQGFIPPSTEELGTNPSGYGGFNPNLEAATSNCFELGIRGNEGRTVSYDVSGFYTATKNDFDRYRIPGRGNGEEGTFYKNIGASKRLGFEFAGSYQPVSNLTFRAAYTYSNFKYDLSEPIPIIMDDTSDHRAIADGNFLPNSPQHQLVLDLRYEPVPELTLGFGTETFSKSYIDGANLEGDAVSGYTLLNCRILYHWTLGSQSGDLTFQGRNLGNQKYVSFSEPDAGGNAYQPGPGSEIFAGVRINLGK